MNEPSHKTHKTHKRFNASDGFKKKKSKEKIEHNKNSYYL